jgi:hypothetical protein
LGLLALAELLALGAAVSSAEVAFFRALGAALAVAMKFPPPAVWLFAKSGAERLSLAAIIA